MAKHIVPTSYLSGTERIEIMPYFLYEISAYKIYKDRVELLYSEMKAYKDKLNIKKWSIKIKKGDYILLKCISWLGAPEEFIINNNLKLY